jgi:CBS domain-containing protein
MKVVTAEMTASDILTPDVVCLNESLDVHQCEKILIDRGISGAPVVDDQGRLQGVLSKTDLISHHYTSGEESTVEAPFKVDQTNGTHVVEFSAPNARDVMTPVPFTAPEGATLNELAAIMTRQEMHRVVITRKDRIVGIVTSMDILRAIASELPADWDPSGFPG